LFDLLGQLLQQGVDITRGFIGILAAVTANRLLKSLAVEGAGAGTCSAAGSMGRRGRPAWARQRQPGRRIGRHQSFAIVFGRRRGQNARIIDQRFKQGHNSTSLKRSANS
jgi:hypothetical protein